MSVSAPAPSSSPADFAQIARETAAWTVDSWFELVVAIAIGVGIYLALELVRSYGKALCRRGEARAPLFAIVGKAVGKTSHIFLIVASGRIVTGFIPLPVAIFEATRFLFTIIAVIQVAIWVRALILGYVDLRTKDSHANAEALSNASGLIRVLVTTAIFAIATIVVLDNLGVNVTGLVAGLGIGGIAIGLAAQGIFSDLFAALSIILDQPFKVGEVIAFDGSAAVVEKIGLKSTRLRFITGEKRIISNANLLDKDITSYAELDRRRINFAVGVIYQTEPEEALRIPDILREIVEANEGAFIRCGFVGFGESSLDFSLEFDVMSGDWDKVFMIRHRIGLTILKRFNAEGFEFAYPTQTTFTSDPEGKMIMPYPESWPIVAEESGQAT